MIGRLSSESGGIGEKYYCPITMPAALGQRPVPLNRRYDAQMNDAAPEPPGPRAAGRAAGAAPLCIVCGYDLRASPPEGRCPECGAAVERSLHGDWLRYADQRWVATVQRGLNWMWTSLGVLLGVFAVFVLTVPIVLLTDPDGFHPLVDWSLYVVVVGIVVALAFAGVGLIVGLWLVTTLEPRMATSEPLRPWILRTLIIALVPSLASIVVNTGGSAALVILTGWGGLVVAVGAPLVIGAQAYLLLHHIQSLEQRCGGFDEDRTRVLGKYLRGVRGFTIAIVGLTVLFYSSIRTSETGTSIMAIVWLAAMSQVGETRRRIRAELDMHTQRSEENAG